MTDYNSPNQESIRQADRDRLSNIEGNFVRLEDKIDKLSEILVSMARAEEKLVTLEQRNDRAHERADELTSRVDNLEEFKMTVRVINRVFWIVVTTSATVGAGAYFYPLFRGS